MNDDLDLKQQRFLDEEIDVIELLTIIWKKKLTIILITILGWFIASTYANTLPNIYISKTLLAPTTNSSNTSQLSALQVLTGVAAPQSEVSNESEAIARLSSLSFFEDRIMPNIFLPDLMALNSWDSVTNTLIYKNKLYDSEKNEWISGIPSAQSSFGIFLSHIEVERSGSFQQISVKHQSPFIAKEWLDIIIAHLNEDLRKDQRARALLSIEYLYKQIGKTSFAEIKQGLSALIQAETEKLMLIEANEDYVFRKVDSPFVAESPSEPNRSRIKILGAIMGGFLGIFFVLFTHFRKSLNLRK